MRQRFSGVAVLFDFFTGSSGLSLMPIYEYRCSACGTIFEDWVKTFDTPDHKPCPDCGGDAQKIISDTSFLLKGTGWYATQYGAMKGHDEGGPGISSPDPAKKKKAEKAKTEKVKKPAKAESKAADAKPAEAAPAEKASAKAKPAEAPAAEPAAPAEKAEATPA